MRFYSSILNVIRATQDVAQTQNQTSFMQNLITIKPKTRKPMVT